MNDKYNEQLKDELFKYGLFVIFFNSSILLIILFIGFLLEELPFTILFLMLFIPIRVMLGGSHFQKPTYCFIFSSVFFSLSVFLYKYSILPSNKYLLIIPLYFISIYFYIKESQPIWIIILFTFECILSPFSYLISNSAYYAILLVSLLYLLPKFKEIAT